MSKIKKSESTFSKAQILASKKYKHNIDILTVLLKDGERYSIDEVEKLINKYMKGSVK